MTSTNSRISPRRQRAMASALLHAAALVLAVAMAIPSIAADSRPVKSRVAPVYPEIAKRLRIEGAVKIDATVDPSGKVIDVKTISGPHSLSPAAEDAVRKWRFVPAPDQSTVTVEIVFSL
jgi:TonB family protein